MGRGTSWTKDWLLLGLATGMAAGITKSLVNLVLDKAGLPTAQYGPYAGAWMLGRRVRLGLIQGLPRTPGEQALGWAADTLYGGIFGAGISYVISKTPPGHEVLKGMAGGATLWATVIGGLHQLKEPRTYTAGQLTTMLGLNVFYGGLQGALLQRLGQGLAAERQPLAPGRVSEGEEQPFLVAAAPHPRATPLRQSRHLRVHARRAPKSVAAHHPERESFGPTNEAFGRRMGDGLGDGFGSPDGGGFGDGYLDGRDYSPSRA